MSLGKRLRVEAPRDAPAETFVFQPIPAVAAFHSIGWRQSTISSGSLRASSNVGPPGPDAGCRSGGLAPWSPRSPKAGDLGHPGSVGGELLPTAPRGTPPVEVRGLPGPQKRGDLGRPPLIQAGLWDDLHPTLAGKTKTPRGWGTRPLGAGPASRCWAGRQRYKPGFGMIFTPP